jgi:hypothetical protein
MAKRPAPTRHTVEDALRGRDSAATAIYRLLLRRIAGRGGVKGPIGEDPKKTCVHLTAGEHGSAFLGVHPRSTGLLLTVISERPIESSRVRKAVQASARRCYNDVAISSAKEIDAEFIGWAADSYRLVNGAA